MWRYGFSGAKPAHKKSKPVMLLTSYKLWSFEYLETVQAKTKSIEDYMTDMSNLMIDHKPNLDVRPSLDQEIWHSAVI